MPSKNGIKILKGENIIDYSDIDKSVESLILACKPKTEFTLEELKNLAKFFKPLSLEFFIKFLDNMEYWAFTRACDSFKMRKEFLGNRGKEAIAVATQVHGVFLNKKEAIRIGNYWDGPSKQYGFKKEKQSITTITKE